MRVAGIIAEYNPLHNGHVYHIEKTRELTGCDYVIVVISGDFVQRGEPAVADKFTRAHWALTAGADMVLELPAVCALSSAERFAYGGVRVLAGTGVLTSLCFGSETTDIQALYEAADYARNESPAFKKHLREQLAAGKSYPRARYDALFAMNAPAQVLSLLRMPNSILAMEYIRFVRQYAPQAEPVAIQRIANGYNDRELTGKLSSATAIREALLRNDPLVQDSMPMYVAGRFLFGTPPISLADAELLLLYALRRMDAPALFHLPDVAEGFENVLYRAARTASSLEELLAGLKSKRYTMARLKRLCMHAFLGFTKNHVRLLSEEDALYIRVLGFKKSARALLTAIHQKQTLPLVVRRADMHKCPEHAQSLLQMDVHAHELYSLLSRGEKITADFARPPILL